MHPCATRASGRSPSPCRAGAPRPWGHLSKSCALPASQCPAVFWSHLNGLLPSQLVPSSPVRGCPHPVPTLSPSRPRRPRGTCAVCHASLSTCDGSSLTCHASASPSLLAAQERSMSPHLASHVPVSLRNGGGRVTAHGQLHAVRRRGLGTAVCHKWSCAVC